jgi:hypothetical protein
LEVCTEVQMFFKGCAREFENELRKWCRWLSLWLQRERA